MKHSAAALQVVILAALMAAGGCDQPPKVTLTRHQLIDVHNANARAIPQLWARARIAMTLTDEELGTFSWGSTSPLAPANGLLLYARGDSPLGPHDFVLIGRTTGATELFRLGNSATEGVYYLWSSYGERGAAWWGRDELAGAPGLDIPIDPLQLLAVLNITPCSDDFTTLPTTLLTLTDRRPWSYVLTTIDRQPVTGEILCRREVRCIWADGKEPLPYRVDLFDAAGRRVMTASLKDYRPIDVGNNGEVAPWMPTDIKVVWPQKRSHIHLVLSEMTTEAKWDRRQALFEPHRPRGIAPEKVIQVDKGLGVIGEEQ